MYAVLRVDRKSQRTLFRTATAALGPVLALVLSACSMLQEALPGGNGSIRGSVLSDHYSLEMATRSEGESVQLSIPGDGGSDVLRSAGSGAPYVPGEVLVQYRSGSGGISALSTRRSAASARRVELAPGENLAAAIRRLSHDPDVLIASPNYYIYPTALPDDPYLPQQWSLPAAGLPVTWDRPAVAEVTVAVIDSGFDLGHEDLSAAFLPGYDFCANLDCSAGDADPGNGAAGNWHGTHVAGVVAAIGDNGVGVKGVADSAAVRIVPVKVFNVEGGGSNTDVLIRGMRWAVGLPVEGAPANPYPAQIVNLSLAGDFSSEVLQPTVDEVRAAGALIVVSTGNAGIDRVMSPAAADGVLGVGSINSAFERSCFSNYSVGPNGPGGVDIVAPGGEADGSIVSCGVGAHDIEGLMSPIPGNAYGSAVGTSMAAPMVSGAAAVLLSQEPDLSVDELEARLLEASYFDAAYMSDSEYGAGILRADKALGYLGPGDSVLVELTGADSGEGRQLPLTLGLSATGVDFSFDGIEAGSYHLRAEDPQSGLLLTGLSVSLSPGQELRADLVLQQSR